MIKSHERSIKPFIAAYDLKISEISLFNQNHFPWLFSPRKVNLKMSINSGLQLDVKGVSLSTTTNMEVFFFNHHQYGHARGILFAFPPSKYGSIPVHQQYGHAGCFHRHHHVSPLAVWMWGYIAFVLNFVYMLVFPFPPSAVWSWGCISFLSCSVDVQGASLSPSAAWTCRVYPHVSIFTVPLWQCGHPSPLPAVNVQGISLSTFLNAEMSSIQSVRHRNEQKCQFQNQSGTRIRGSSPVLERSGVEL